MLLNNQWIKQEIKKYLEINENKNTAFQSLWDAAKAVLGGKFMAMHAYLKKQEKSQIKQHIFTFIRTIKRRTNKIQNR